MELITKLSGLLKAITHTIRVICRVNFKTVQMCENFVVKSFISSSRGPGSKPLPANFGVLIAFVCVLYGMWFTAKGRPL